MLHHDNLGSKTRAQVVTTFSPGSADVPPPAPDVVPLPTPPAPPGPDGEPVEIIEPPFPRRHEPVREPFVPVAPVRGWH